MRLTALDSAAAALLALTVGLAACGGGASTDPSESDGVPSSTRFELDASAREQITVSVLNMVGPTSVADEDWFGLVTQGCERGAWDWDLAREMADTFALAHSTALPATAGPDLPHILWL